MHRLQPLLDPASIAIVGASNNPARIGGMPIAHLTKFGYAGAIYPINPKYQEVFGLRCWPDIESLPAAPDLVVLAIAAADVLPMLRRCAARGVRAVIVYAAGFAEEGERGAALQAELAAYVASTDMVVAGPNVMGFANLNTQAHTIFASVFNTAPMQAGKGSVSLLTQSGNVCAAVYAIARRLGVAFSHFINTGNEACVDFAQYLEYLAQDDATEVAMGYIEELRDGERFMAAAETFARSDKLLILYKAGETEKGSEAVRSHTSALAGIEWDKGNDYFPPTGWQISNIHGGTGAGNVIPGSVVIDFNFRFSTASTPETLQQRLEAVLRSHQLDYSLEWTLGGKPFLTPAGVLVDAARHAIAEMTGLQTQLSTSGGTSDGRFIAPICPQVIELGPPNASIHKVDEHIALADMAPLSAIYRRILELLENCPER